MGVPIADQENALMNHDEQFKQKVIPPIDKQFEPRLTPIPQTAADQSDKAPPGEGQEGEMGEARNSSEPHTDGSVSSSKAVSVKLMTLGVTNTVTTPGQRSSAVVKPSPDFSVEDSSIPAMTQLNLVRDFQARRRHDRQLSSQPAPSKRHRDVFHFGLFGKCYFGNSSNDAINATNKDSSGSNHTTPATARSTPTPAPHLKTCRYGQTVGMQDGGHYLSEQLSVVGRGEDNTLPVPQALRSPKDSDSPALSLPPLSSGVGREGGIWENTALPQTMGGHPASSLLEKQFGFSSVRSDTFCGLGRYSNMRLTSTDKQELLRELEREAQRQILACQNMGFTHRGSRAAHSVQGLKNTVSPTAFHQPSFLTRRPVNQRLVPPLQEREAGERKWRRAPGSVGRLTVTRVLVDHHHKPKPRSAALPSVSGSSVPVILTAGSHRK